MAVEAVRQPEVAGPAPTDIVVDLLKPVQAHGDTVKQLVFRHPTGGDLMQMGDGYPIIINYTTGQVIPHPTVMGAMMATLAGVPPSTIRLLDAEDWATCAYRLINFFVPRIQET